jgi:hypothetical protein
LKPYMDGWKMAACASAPGRAASAAASAKKGSIVEMSGKRSAQPKVVKGSSRKSVQPVHDEKEKAEETEVEEVVGVVPSMVT